MSVQRRNSSDLARNLFSEQLRNILTLAVRYRRHKKQQEKLNESVELLIDHTDGKLRIISDYKKQLRKCVQTQILFVNRKANELFNVLDLRNKSVLNSAFFEGVFIAEHEVSKLIKSSQKINEAIREKQIAKGKPLYALLKVHLKDKTVFMPGLVNGHVINDVKQSQQSFYQKSVIRFTQDEEQHKELIIEHLHLSLIEHMKSLLVPAIAKAKGKRCLIADEDSENPNVYLTHLKDLMLHPEKVLQVDTLSIKTNRFGIKVNSENKDSNILLERDFNVKQVNIDGVQPYLLIPVVIHL